jgi:hypothetical protein
MPNSFRHLWGSETRQRRALTNTMVEANIIIQEWGLQGSGLHTKEAILEALAARIIQLMSGDPMAFIQLMYRLDIPEAQFEAAMDAPNAEQLLAEIIWNRQVQKSILRKTTRPRSTDAEDSDLAW